MASASLTDDEESCEHGETTAEIHEISVSMIYEKRTAEESVRLFRALVDGDTEVVKQMECDLTDRFSFKCMPSAGYHCMCGIVLEDLHGSENPVSSSNDFDLDEVCEWLREGQCGCVSNEAIIAAGGEPSICSVSPLHVSASWGHLGIVTYLLDSANDYLERNCTYQALVANRTPLGRYSALHSAVLSFVANTDIVQRILSSGPPRMKDFHSYSSNNTALHYALSCKRLDIVKILLEAGCDIDVTNAEGRTPLYLAVLERNAQAVRVLVEAGANLGPPSGLGPPIHVLSQAAHIGNVEVMRELLEADCDVNLGGHTRYLPFNLAAYAGHIEIMKMLLAKGANPDLDMADFTPLLAAAQRNNANVVKTLIEGRCDVAKTNDRGYTALHSAAWDGHVKVCQMLLDAGAPHDTQTSDLNTALSLACHGDFESTASLLLPLGCDVNNADKDRDTPMHYAAYNGNVPLITKLLEHGAHPDPVNNFGCTPFWNAVHNGNSKAVQTLLQQNVSTDIMSRGIDQHAHSAGVVHCYTSDKSCLYLACDKGHWDVVRMLVNVGVDISREAWLWSGNLPRALAHNTEMLSELMARGVTPRPLLRLCLLSILQHQPCGSLDKLQQLQIPKYLIDMLTFKIF